ncbi:serine hydrolase domain-containing protein [Aquimarina sp. 2201CG14-23]|uniref:serine hydrolase domain-containing protein n=1 Tax=Aquimarina mycalae TaxID=3040073 RepID=UPI0024780A7E|nr:serine hydrolase domain-containing protein [Aquimarina sp. 2201CG14-23]MDH7444425.1 serine hydrolase domain-containing protein [Aquimarina sp. 2201CG14-23]
MRTFLIILGSLILLGIAALAALFFYFKNANKVEITPATSSLITQENITKEKVDSIFKYTKNFPDNTQLSFAFIDGDTVSYYGILRKEGALNTVQNSDSIFQIGSISKVFTSTLLADFVYNEKVDLTAPIQQYLNTPLHNIEKDGKFITLKSLSNHTSGLPRLPKGMLMNSILNMDDPYKNYTQDKFEKYLQEKLAPETTPGTKMAYSNLGVGLLGHILSEVSGKNFETLLQEKIFIPYKMNSSSSLPSIVENRLVSGLSPKGDKVPAWTFSSMHGMGAINSNVEDLAKFAQANFTINNILNLQRIKTFEKNEKRSVALGWMIINTKKSNELYFHNGATGGYMSSMLLDIKNKKGVIILSNVNFSHPDSKNLDKLCFTLAGMQP